MAFPLKPILETGTSGPPPAPEPGAFGRTRVSAKPIKMSKAETVNMDLVIDPDKIRAQKGFLLGLLEQEVISFSKDEEESLESIINLYDYIGDILVEAHGYSEEQIFGISEHDD
jgi:hypothetical protein